MITYRVDIREVWISTREVKILNPAMSQENIIRFALDGDNEVEFEYSHTMDLEYHTVEEVK